jgi:tRNA 2-thiouridine synthesizing protein A
VTNPADDATYVDVLDARGLYCPLPVVKTRERLRTLSPGSRLDVIADDPLARLDMQTFCAREGHAYLGHSEDAGGGWRMALRKPRRSRGLELLTGCYIHGFFGSVYRIGNARRGASAGWHTGLSPEVAGSTPSARHFRVARGPQTSRSPGSIPGSAQSRPHSNNDPDWSYALTRFSIGEESMK